MRRNPFIHNLIFVLLLQSFISGWSQETVIYEFLQDVYEFPLVNFKLANGMSDCAIYSMLEDHYGFIWFGTQNSLIRFDGYDYTIYKFDNIGSGGFKGCMVRDIVEDKEGNIWIGTNLGINKLDRTSGLFTFYQPNPDNMDDHANCIGQLYFDRNGSLWARTRNKILCLDTVNGKFLSIGIDSLDFMYFEQFTGFSDCPIDNHFAEDSLNRVWIATINGLIMYDGNTKETKHFRHKENDNHSLGSDYISALYIDPKNRLWITTYGGGLHLLTDPDKGEFKKIHFDPGKAWKESVTHFKSICPSENNNIWITGKRGITCFNTDSQTSIHYSFSEDGAYPKIFMDRNDGIWIWCGWSFKKFNPSQKKLIEVRPTQYSYDAFQDKSGSIWLGSAFSSAFRLDLQTPRYRQYEGMWMNRCLLEDSRGTIWYADRERNGIFGYGLSQIILGPYSSEIKKIPFDFPDNVNTSISMTEDSSGFLWFMGAAALRKYNPLSKTSNIYELPVRHHPFHAIKMAADKSGNIWFGGERYYLYEFNAKTEKFRSIFPEIITSTDSLDYYTVNHLYIDQYNILWASTQKGILKIDISTGKIERIRSILGNQESLNDDTPAMILEDNNGLLWILGSKTGLSYYERDKKIFHAVPFPDQLNSVTYKVIKKDKNGNFWITHNAGFSRFNPLDFKTKCFNLPEKQAGSNVITLRCGELFFDNSEGDKRVFRFHVDSFNNNTYIPPVWIVKMTVNSREVSDILDWQQAGNENSLQFKYNENNITFEFTALNYTEPEKNQFRYYLSGIKRDTVDAGISRKAEFIGLPPGNYNFWVTGSNNDGLWNPSGTNVNFRISPPWYSTFIARLVYLIFLICLIIFIIKWRTNSLQREKLRLESVVLKRTEQIEEQKHNIELQQEKLLEMDEYKTRFFTNISHEFRSPLTIILGLSDDLLNKLQSRQITNEKLKHIWRNAKRLLGLVNQLLDVSKISSNKMKLELIETDIIDILRTLSASFSSLAESKMITFSYNLPIVTKLCFCDPDKIEKILINLLSNAFKFTPNGGKISIEAEYLNSEEFDSGVLKLKVADTGIGMTESDQKKIFDRFYQAEEHIKSAKGGTGIGLSLVKDLVQLMHGEISLSSKPGSGSIFTVSIPLGINHLSQDEYKLSKTLTESSEEESDSNSFIEIEYEIPEIKSATHKKLDISTLLVVEDNKDIRNYISENFRDSYNILEAYDGESGLITALQEMPDIIITDLMMPHLNGLEMCKKIKTDERTSHIPVIMLTAKAEIDDKLMGLKTGADDYLIKPFEMKELKVRVKNLIELRKKLRERFSREITIEPADITITPIDEKFLKKAISIVETHLSETDYDVEYLQQDMNMSRSTLSRKIKALTNYSPVEFIRFMRLKRAANLLDQGFGNVTEVAMEVGFNSPSYFAKWFKKTFGVSPLLFAKQKGISSN